MVLLRIVFSRFRLVQSKHRSSKNEEKGTKKGEPRLRSEYKFWHLLSPALADSVCLALLERKKKEKKKKKRNAHTDTDPIIENTALIDYILLAI